VKLHVNGETLEFSDGLGLEELIRQLGIKKEAVVAEVNRRVIQPSDREGLRLAEGDQVELITFVGGG
jgi:sulfur carrier protein